MTTVTMVAALFIASLFTILYMMIFLASLLDGEGLKSFVWPYFAYKEFKEDEKEEKFEQMLYDLEASSKKEEEYLTKEHREEVINFSWRLLNSLYGDIDLDSEKVLRGLCRRRSIRWYADGVTKGADPKDLSYLNHGGLSPLDEISIGVATLGYCNEHRRDADAEDIKHAFHLNNSKILNQLNTCIEESIKVYEKRDSIKELNKELVRDDTRECKVIVNKQEDFFISEKSY